MAALMFDGVVQRFPGSEGCIMSNTFACIVDIWYFAGIQSVFHSGLSTFRAILSILINCIIMRGSFISISKALSVLTRSGRVYVFIACWLYCVWRKVLRLPPHSIANLMAICPPKCQQKKFLKIQMSITWKYLKAKQVRSTNQ